MFKKLLLFAALILTVQVAKAGWLDNDDVVVRVRAGVSQTTTQNSSMTILVALSSNTWPHYTYGIREYDIAAIRWSLDKVATSTCTLKLGIVTYVGGVSSGSVTWIWARTFEKNVNNTNMEGYENYENCHIKCRVNIVPTGNPVFSGVTPFILSNDISTGTVTITSSTVMNSVMSGLNPTAQVHPNVGDLVFLFQNNMQAETASFEVSYHSKPQ